MKKIKKILVGCLLSLGLSNNLIAVEIENIKDLISDQYKISYRDLIEMGAEISIPIGIKNSKELIFLDIDYHPEPFPEKLYTKEPLKFEEIPAPKMYIRLPTGKKYDISQKEIIKLSGADLRKTLKQININLEFCKKVESFQYLTSYYDLERNEINSGKILIGNNKIFCDENMSYLPDALFRSLTLENI